MPKETIELLIEGGKATAGPEMGQKLGPMGINIADILAKINEKTSSFKGMKVPVKIIIDTETKEFDISVGTPPVSQLIKKELNLEKGSSTPKSETVGNIAIEQIIKIAKMKQDSMLTTNFKAAVLSVVGTCDSLGILIEGKISKDISKEIKKGKYDKEINEEKTEVDKEKQKKLKEELKEVQGIEEQEKKEEEEKAKEEEAAKEEKAKEEAEAGEQPTAGEEPQKPEEEAAEEKPEEKTEEKEEPKK
jgi:large subunit ribosomal protein L11